jgi:hypothetical protein
VTLRDEARAKVAAEALELARGLLATCDLEPNRPAAVNLRCIAESPSPIMAAMGKALMGAHASWGGLADDAAAGEPVAIEAARRMIADAIDAGEPVPAPLRALAGGMVRGDAIQKRPGRVRADHRVRDIWLGLAVYGLVYEHGFAEGIALAAVVAAANERRANLEVKALRGIYRSIPSGHD